jgi:predicted nucleic acid-binding protein
VPVVDALLDTSVLVDLWRKHPPALSWAEAQRELVIGVHVLVGMELVEGVRNSRELAHLDRLLADYDVVFLTPSDCVWASEQHRRLRLGHGVGVLDALIASSAVRLNVPLYTLNLKHFQSLPDVKAIRPY